jgi:head fiber protein
MFRERHDGHGEEREFFGHINLQSLLLAMKKLILALVAVYGLIVSAEAQKISQLPSGGAVSDSDLYITVQGGANYKVTAAQLRTYVGSSTYTLPVATTLTLGGVKQGSNVTIAGDGTISVSSLSFSLLTGTPTTLSGYGITDPIVLTSGSYANPSWITSLAYSKLTGAPTIPAAQVNSDWSAGSGVAQILNKPIAGTQVITHGVSNDFVTVSGLNLGFTPSFVFITTRKSNANGINIFAIVRGSSISSDGFVADLSCYIDTTDTYVYNLDYMILR